MKKKTKLKLDEIKVESFITSLNYEAAQGGNSWQPQGCNPDTSPSVCNSMGCPSGIITCSGCGTNSYPC